MGEVSGAEETVFTDESSGTDASVFTESPPPACVAGDTNKTNDVINAAQTTRFINVQDSMLIIFLFFILQL